MASKPTKARKVRTGSSSKAASKSTSTNVASKVAGSAVSKAKSTKLWARIEKNLTWQRGLQATAIFVGFFSLVGLFYAKELPSPDKINSTINAQTTKLYDRTGTHVLEEIYGDKNRSLIAFDQMPAYCKDATISIEDKDFYKHGAFSVPGIARAFYYTVFKHNTEGGSTITQQYVKNAFLSDTRTPARKIKELILSMEIETLYPKDDILKLYLNEIPYGSTAYGLEAAAKTYFAKDAQNLDLSQCALLAAMPQAPTYYSPYGQHTDALIARQQTILDKMAQQHYITDAQAAAAKQVDILAEIQPQNIDANVFAPHFDDYVRGQLEDEFGVKTVDEGGLKVITTLDYDKQNMAQTAVANNMASVRHYGGSNAALVAEDPTNGQVLAMVGSYNYSDPTFGSYNVATALRQPGSSFKPITYSTLFKKNYGPGSTFYDVKTDFGGGYTPANYTNRNYGVVSIRQAFASSLNVIAVKALYIAGIDNALQTARDLGITTLNAGADHYGLSLTLGSGEVQLTQLVNAYATFPQAGEHRNQISVLKVTDPTGKVLVDNTKPDQTNKPKQVLDPQIAYLISSIISDNAARCSLGTFTCNNPLTLGDRPVAAKTGTTQDYRDAWTMGYTPYIVAGVWAGNDNNAPMTQAASIVSAPIWHDFMQAATANDPKTGFTRPPGIQTVTLDADTGKIPTDSTKHTRTDIFPSWYKPVSDSTIKSVKIDKVSGLLATSCTPPDAIDTKTSGAIQAEIPPTDVSFARWNPPVQALAASIGFSAGAAIPTTSDNVHSCSDTKPQVSLSVKPSSLTGSVFTLTATGISGTFPINNYVFNFDGNQITSGASNTATYTPPAGTSGQHTFSVTVFDAGLYRADSNTINVTVQPAPDITISCPSSTCTVSVSGAAGFVTTKVQFNSAVQGTKTGANTNWPNYPAGDTVTATVTDDNGTYTQTGP